MEVLAQIPEGILANPSQFAQVDTTEQEVEEILPWRIRSQIGHKSLTNDSLLRWQIWPNWGDFIAYRKDVIAYRQGTIGRLDAFEIDGYAPGEQEVSLNGIPLNNPITGIVNYNHIPSNRVGNMTEAKGSVYESNIRLRDFYLIEPLSYLNFDESALDYRNLEFMVAQNFNERTNAEISFWDRRDGGYYPLNNVQGSQILMKGYHYLNQNKQVRALILRNQFEREESFGYVVPDPQTFAFSQFSTQPIKSKFGSSTSGYESDILRRDFSLGIYSRKDSTSAEEDGLEFIHSKNEYSLPFDSDTLGWNLRTQAVQGFRSFNFSKFTLNTDVSLSRFVTKKNRSLSKSNWGIAKIGSQISFMPSQPMELYSLAKLTVRSDDKIGYSLDVGLTYKSRFFSTTTTVGTYSKIPTIQHMYWVSPEFRGQQNLENIKGLNLSTNMEINWSESFNTGLTARWQSIDQDVFVGTDSSFVNSEAYNVLSGSVWGNFENQRFQIESSAVVHAAFSKTPTNVLDANNKPDRKIWIRNNAYIKGYVFDRAAFVKLGLLTTFSPFPYRARLFNAELQYWENAALNQADIPAYFRMDAELSARVRSMMIVMRWENALDGFGQAGYFEAATLPMPGRRLIVGIRAQFRN